MRRPSEKGHLLISKLNLKTNSFWSRFQLPVFNWKSAAKFCLRGFSESYVCFFRILRFCQIDYLPNIPVTKVLKFLRISRGSIVDTGLDNSLNVAILFGQTASTSQIQMGPLQKILPDAFCISSLKLKMVLPHDGLHQVLFFNVRRHESMMTAQDDRWMIVCSFVWNLFHEGNSRNSACVFLTQLKALDVWLH